MVFTYGSGWYAILLKRMVGAVLTVLLLLGRVGLTRLGIVEFGLGRVINPPIQVSQRYGSKMDLEQ